MPSLNNVVLAVASTEPDDQITCTVNCDIEFSAADVHAMRELRQQYTLRCEIVRKELINEFPVLVYGDREFPPSTGEVAPHVDVEFQLTVPLNALHGGLVGRDDLTARVTLTDTDTGWDIVQYSEQVSIDLVA